MVRYEMWSRTSSPLPKITEQSILWLLAFVAQRTCGEETVSCQERM